MNSSLHQLGGGLLGLIGFERPLGLLDQGQHVAHAQDATRHTVGVELLELGELPPVDAKAIGTPMTSLTDSARTPRASPSIFDMITASIWRVSSNASAV